VVKGKQGHTTPPLQQELLTEIRETLAEVSQTFARFVQNPSRLGSHSLDVSNCQVAKCQDTNQGSNFTIPTFIGVVN